MGHAEETAAWARAHAAFEAFREVPGVGDGADGAALVAEGGQGAGADGCGKGPGRCRLEASGPAGGGCDARGGGRSVVVERDHRVAGQDPGPHAGIARFSCGFLRCGEPSVRVALVAPVVLDDRDEAGNSRCGAGEIGAVTGWVGPGQHLPEQSHVRRHVGEHPVGGAAVVTAPVPFERRLQIGQITIGPGASESVVDAFASLGDRRHGRRDPHCRDSSYESSPVHFVLLLLLGHVPESARGADGGCDRLGAQPVRLGDHLVGCTDREPFLGLPPLQVLRVEPPAALRGGQQICLLLTGTACALPPPAQ
ncbi:hypothetical protein [Streptomyces brevispora]|uniref:Uncharacterized protein n=1 Tax=Streptomyces brevispora TaxID=887462 RepID=A0ABZ1G1Q3_9ACTN|nr:hypothetical protein [Streptomyces brevispora]WSC12663.1 hypothetical protein OIE64_07300 [Streptomyces brevispora]